MPLVIRVEDLRDDYEKGINAPRKEAEVVYETDVGRVLVGEDGFGAFTLVVYGSSSLMLRTNGPQYQDTLDLRDYGKHLMLLSEAVIAMSGSHRP